MTEELWSNAMKMKNRESGAPPVAPGLVQLDEKTLVSVRLARSAGDPGKFRAVALSALQSNRRVVLSSAQTVGYGPDAEAALQACLVRVRTTLTTRRGRPSLRGRRPEATL
jgi:hypothetical protein